jgi:hypothetical protein
MRRPSPAVRFAYYIDLDDGAITGQLTTDGRPGLLIGRDLDSWSIDGLGLSINYLDGSSVGSDGLTAIGDGLYEGFGTWVFFVGYDGSGQGYITFGPPQGNLALITATSSDGQEILYELPLSTPIATTTPPPADPPPPPPVQQPIPLAEPGASGLLLAGVTGVLVAGRRRRNRPVPIHMVTDEAGGNLSPLCGVRGRADTTPHHSIATCRNCKRVASSRELLPALRTASG